VVAVVVAIYFAVVFKLGQAKVVAVVFCHIMRGVNRVNVSILSYHTRLCSDFEWCYSLLKMRILLP
jgi:hypothetical protein